MLETNLNALFASKQTAKGTPNATGTKRFKQVAGDLAVAIDQGSEAWSDMDKYGSQTDFVNSVTGNGSPGIEATPEELAWLLYAYEGGETTSAVPGPPAKTAHVTVPLPTAGFWTTWHKRIGGSQVQRQQFADTRISQIQIEGSTAQKVVRVTPTLLSLDPAQVVAADPVTDLPAKRPFIYTEGSGAFEIDGAVFRGHSQFQVISNADLSVVYGDDAVAYDVVSGTPSVTIACSIYVDADGLAKYNEHVYGTATPAPGAKPLRTIRPYGGYEFNLGARAGATGALTGDAFKHEMPGVKWGVPEAPAANPQGGAAELALAGQMRKVSGSPAYRNTVTCDDAAYV